MITDEKWELYLKAAALSGCRLERDGRSLVTFIPPTGWPNAWRGQREIEVENRLIDALWNRELLSSSMYGSKDGRWRVRIEGQECWHEEWRIALIMALIAYRAESDNP